MTGITSTEMSKILEPFDIYLKTHQTVTAKIVLQQAIEAYVAQRVISELKQLPRQVHSTHATKNYTCTGTMFIRDRIKQLTNSMGGEDNE